MSFDTFATFNIAVLVLALGKLLTQKLAFLRDFNIPEPVTGGLLASLIVAALHLTGLVTLSFNLEMRDFLLLYFFATIGLNSDFRTLMSGGKPLLILISVTVVFMLLQNSTGVAVAKMLGMDPLVGLLGGTVSLVGGHGTTIAWAPTFAENHGIVSASEIGIACATLGLVIASLMGGPAARLLISRHKLQPGEVGEPDIGVMHDTKSQPVDYFSLLRTLFWLNISVILGELLQALLSKTGVSLPLFVCCLFGAIFLTNIVPRVTRLQWPSGSRSLSLVADISLGVFLAMSLMSMQLWTVAEVAGPILAILTAQALLSFAFAIFVIYRFMGADYEAAVMSAGFCGFSMGATPTAMANMTAVAQKYGQAHRAFIIVPLVSGFFIDIANAVIIGRFITWFE